MFNKSLRKSKSLPKKSACLSMDHLVTPWHVYASNGLGMTCCTLCGMQPLSLGEHAENLFCPVKKVWREQQETPTNAQFRDVQFLQTPLVQPALNLHRLSPRLLWCLLPLTIGCVCRPRSRTNTNLLLKLRWSCLLLVCSVVGTCGNAFRSCVETLLCRDSDCPQANRRLFKLR